jgi:hypothetical protein
MKFDADRYKIIREWVWWRIRIGDGTRTVGGFFSKTDAESMAAALLTAFNDGRFVGEQQLAEEQKKGCILCDAEPFGYLWPTGMHPIFRFFQRKIDGVYGMPLYKARTK